MYVDALETPYTLVSSFPSNSEKSLLLNKHNIHTDESILQVDSGSLLKSFFFFNRTDKNGGIIN